MCSNCSGDDLRPESFATFDVSSPKGVTSFAENLAAKRKRYGTSHIFAMFTEATLSQAIIHFWKGAADPGIIRKFDLRSFVNLNSDAASDGATGKTRVPMRRRELLEIRVSADAIIEVFATPEVGERTRDESEMRGARCLSPWPESFAERNELQRTLKDFRRARQLKYFVAYGTLVTCAAVAIWYAFS